MPSSYPIMAPGISSPRTATHRALFLMRSETFLAQGRIIDGTKSRDPGNTGDPGVLRAGLIMGKITATGLYAPSVIGLTQGVYTSGETTFTLTVAQATELARRVGSSGTGYVIGPPTAAGTVAKTALTYSAIDTATGIVTCTSLGVNKIAGSWVTAGDGSEDMLAPIPDWDYGVQVVDIDGNSVSQVDFGKFPISGVIHSPSLIPWASDTSLQARTVAQLNAAAGGQFVFDHIY